MNSFRVPLAALMVLFSTACCHGQQMTIEPIGSNSVVVAPVTLTNGTQGALPATLISITNRSSQAIMCMVIKWTGHVSGRPDDVRWLYLNGYLYPPGHAVISPGSTLIASEFAAQSQTAFAEEGSARRTDSPLASHNGRASLQGSITTTLDLVIFQDGEIVGPNTSRYERQITARHNAMIEIAAELQGLSQDATVTQATSIIQQAKRSTTADAPIRAELAETVLRSPNPVGTVQSYATHTIPTSFYRAAQ